jgi:hypothetical protein
MVSLIIGILWGLAVLGLAFTSNIRGGITSVAIALAGVGLITKSVHIFFLNGGV